MSGLEVRGQQMELLQNYFICEDQRSEVSRWNCCKITLYVRIRGQRSAYGIVAK
jgi:hypothetical protein